MDDNMYFLMENPLLKLLLTENERREWVNPIFAERNDCGEFHTLFPRLKEQPEKFCDYFRMKNETFDYVLNGIRPLIEKHNNFRKCISPEERLALTLRFLSTGLTYKSLAYSYRIAPSTIAIIIYETCDSIWECFVEEHMPFPTIALMEKTAKEYEEIWNFPNCVGSIDGKHVRIKCPKLSGSKHFNYKNYHSVVLQGVVDAKYRFLSVDCGAYGRQSDSGIFAESNLYHHIETGSFPFPQARQIPGTNTHLPYVFLGDQGYPLKNFLMRPYTTSGATVSREIEVYNYRHSRARKTVECAFGILVAKWRVMKTEIQVDPKKVDKLVSCACLLHNIVIDKEGIFKDQLDMALASNTPDGKGTRSPTEISKRYNRAGTDAYNIRDGFKNYFNSEGAIDFQYNKIDYYVQ